MVWCDGGVIRWYEEVGVGGWWVHAGVCVGWCMECVRLGCEYGGWCMVVWLMVLVM